MKLRSGIKVICEPGTGNNKFCINSGTINASNYDRYNEKKYADDAYKPKIDWRALTADESEMIISYDDHLSFFSNIAFKKLPKHIINQFGLLALHDVDDEESIKNKLRENPVILDEITQSLNTLLFSMLADERDLQFHRLTFTRPGLETITYYPKLSDNAREYIGLHIDKSEPIIESTIGTTRNRLCINISGEARDLLIVNLTLQQVLDMLRQVPELAETIIDPNEVTALFFHFFPDYPVIKITQEPYEYYLAPTDNFFHDGSTLNKTRLDYTLIYLGYFNLYSSEQFDSLAKGIMP
jgi:hypothetical protein